MHLEDELLHASSPLPMSEAVKVIIAWAHKRDGDEKTTYIDNIVTDTRLPRADVSEFAKMVAEHKYGRYVIGRRGGRSRIEWLDSLKSFLRHFDRNASDEKVEDQTASEPQPPVSPETLSLTEAKRILAKSLGVRVTDIENIVKA